MTEAQDEFEAAGFAKVDPSAASQQDEFEAAGFKPVGQSFDSGSGALGVVAETGGRGVLESSGALSGAAIGAVAGGSVGGPPGALIGGVTGLVGGYFAGDMAASSLGLRSPEQLPPEQRPAGYFGQSLGGSIPFAVAPYGVAATGIRFGNTAVGNFLNRIVTTAKTSPIRFGLAEATTATSAATGAGLAESMAPGEPGYRAVGEVAGGLLNPTKLALDGYRFASNVTRRAYQAMSSQGRETAAARVIADILSVTDENAHTIARVLRDEGTDGVKNLTAAQKTGSMGLAALQDYLVTQSSKFGAESRQQAIDGLDTVRQMIGELSSTGDPAALTAAAQIRQSYFRTLIQGRVDGATREAIEAAGRITADTPEAREVLSEQARDVLMKAITDSRAVESQLWDQVPKDHPVGFQTLRQTFDETVAEMLPEIRGEKTPKVVRDFLKRVAAPRKGQESAIILPENIGRATAEPIGTNLGEVRQLRSELLDMARASSNAGEYGQARIYNKLAEAALNDIDIAFRDTGNSAYEEARTFSREFNDVFTRSFVGKVTGTGKHGDRVDPELTLRKALATGKEAGAIQLQQLEESTRFLEVRGMSGPEDGDLMLDAQERFLRLAAADSIGADGTVNPESLRKFVRDNATLMNRFPTVKETLEEAIKSETARSRITDLAKQRTRFVEQRAAFAEVAKGDPITITSKALFSMDQDRLITRLAQLTKDRSGKLGIDQEKATEGLRSALFEAAASKARSANVTDPIRFRDLMFTPMRPRQRSPIQVMQDEGIIDAKQVQQIRELLDVAENINRSSRPGTAIEVRTDLTDAAVATISRMIGSGVAGGVARGAGSSTPSLIVHGAGARLAETAMTKIPVQSTQNVLIAAMNDPILMERLLKKAASMTPEQEAAQARQIHAWLVQSGLTHAPDVVRGIGALLSEEEQ